MSTIRRKPKLLLNTAAVDLGCSCRKLKLSSIFSPKPKAKLPKYQPQRHHHSHYSSSSSSGQTTSTFSPFMDYPSSSSDDPHCVRFGLVGSKTVAIEKESDDPYFDFRQSMLQMIRENEIRSKDDLKELLNCFLQLNSPCLHGIIIRAFTEIWNNFFFFTPSATAGRCYRSNISPKVYARSKSYEI